LYSVGKSEQARKILANLHSSNGDYNSPLVDLEMEEIEEKIEVDGVDSTFGRRLEFQDISDFLRIAETWWDFRPLFTTRADRYRAYMVILIGARALFSVDELV
jgi:hypothetical protein